jgi:hypothetical protein
VEPQIRAALYGALSFERRDLAQDVRLSDVISLIQRVPGVEYVDVDTLDRVSETVTPEELRDLSRGLKRNEWIIVEPARYVREENEAARRSSLRPAQLAYLTSELRDTLILQERMS